MSRQGYSLPYQGSILASVRYLPEITWLRLTLTLTLTITLTPTLTPTLSSNSLLSYDIFQEKLAFFCQYLENEGLPL